jgi:hypothetical protein
MESKILLWKSNESEFVIISNLNAYLSNTNITWINLTNFLMGGPRIILFYDKIFKICIINLISEKLFVDIKFSLLS